MVSKSEIIDRALAWKRLKKEQSKAKAQPQQPVYPKSKQLSQSPKDSREVRHQVKAPSVKL